MKIKVNEVPLVGPRGRRKLLNSINSLEERIEEVNSSIIQADFNQKDSTKPDYIKNKPEPLTPDDILDAVAQKEYFTFEAVGDSTSIYFVAETYEDDEEDEYKVDRTIEVSTDCINWTKKTASEEETLLATLNAGGKLYIRGTNNSYATTDYATNEVRASYFKTDKDVYVYGNILSLLVGDNFLSNYSYISPSIGGSYTFAKLFQGVGEYLHLLNDKKLVLLSNYAAYYGYYKMFAGCTKITFTPKLPTINVGPCAYYGMFEGCTSLKDAPELPAKYLGKSAYKEMFKGCTNLENVPKELPASLVTNDSVYYGMFEGCTKLTKAPEILTTRFGNNTAARMFYGCSKLTNVTCHVRTKTSNSTENWLYGVNRYGSMEVPKGSEIWETNSPSGVPSGWILYKTFE